MADNFQNSFCGLKLVADLGEKSSVGAGRFQGAVERGLPGKNRLHAAGSTWSGDLEFDARSRRF
jgi:hypothetical protein